MDQDHTRLAEAARAIRMARAEARAIPRISESHRVIGLEEAYAVAAINTRARLQEPGRRIIGLKVGLTSKAVQSQLGVDQPDFGVLFDDMACLDGDAVPVDGLIQPKVEAEVAFVVGHDLEGEQPSYGEFLAALACALPALEIVDSVIQDWKITLVDTVADNASSALFVLGHQPVAIGALDLGEVGMQMTVNGAVVSVGTGAACLGHPLRAAYWLAQTMAARGQPLKSGQVILSGALGPMVALKGGDVVSARIGGLGTVSCSMVAKG